MLNDGKTELMLVGTRQQLKKINLNDITVGDSRRGGNQLCVILGHGLIII